MNAARTTVRLLTLALLASSVTAQWSSDPAVNLSVADGASDQVQPKVVPASGGGAWVSWFDGIANGFDVRVQRLTGTGGEVFAHNGVLVANRGFSSTQDYGLDTDASGNALLAYRDDSGIGTQITANKVTSAGALSWGASGVQLTATAAFVAAPRIAGTSDGGAVVAWTQDTTVRIQKLDSAGAPVWVSDVVLTPGAGSYSVSDLHDAGTDVVLSFVHQTGGFGSPRHILAQKLDSTGALLWGAGHVAVFDGGSLQFGNFPSFLPDGSGGGVFTWYEVSPLQCRVQRILSNGTEAFAHDGVTVSTNAARLRVEPSAAFDAGSGATVVFWVELNSTQSQFGLYAQRIDSGGNRLWGAEGTALIPLGADPIGLVRALPSGTGAFGFWKRGGFGAERLYGTRLDSTGSVAIATFDVASTASGKSRLAATVSNGQNVLAWGDDRVDASDVLAQNVTAGGSLGPPVASVPALPTWGLALLALCLALVGGRRVR